PRERRLFCARLLAPAAGRRGVPRSRNRLSEDRGPGRPRLRLRTRGRRAQLQAGESESLENLTDNLARVRERVRRAAERAGRSPEEVTIVAVTKGGDAPTGQAALEQIGRASWRCRVWRW